MKTTIIDSGGYIVRNTIAIERQITYSRIDASGDRLVYALAESLASRGDSYNGALAIAESIIDAASDSGEDQYLLSADGHSVVIVPAPHVDLQSDMEDANEQLGGQCFRACIECGAPGHLDAYCPFE